MGTPLRGVKHKRGSRSDFEHIERLVSGSLNRVPASAGVKAGKSPLPGGR